MKFFTLLMTSISFTFALLPTGHAAELELEFSTQGFEFRDKKIVPKDQDGLGYSVNAWNSYHASCEQAILDVERQFSDNLVSFDCGLSEVKELSRRKGRRRYGSQAKVIFSGTELHLLE